MSKNDNLNTARKVKNDEFYTRLEDIEEKLQHYKDYFKGKVIYCNCDDYTKSNFVKYFKTNFKSLGLKKLLVSGYSIDDKNGVGAQYYIKDNQLIEEIIECSGDYRENSELLKEADIVVTNPPFSLLREYINFIKGKKFVIVGNINTITCKGLFPLFMNEEVRFDCNNNSGIYFEVPDNHVYSDSYKGKRLLNGKKVYRISAACWFTNFDITNKSPIPLTKKYSEADYPKYDNYSAIECNNIYNIPSNYNDVVGVPITYLLKHNPTEFQLVGLLNTPVINGKNIYKRVLIKKK